LTYDANKGVSWINYDQWGNPIRVQFTDHSITEHVYTADGRRLKTIHRTSIPQSNPLGIGVTAPLTPAQTQSTDSVDYVGNFIYEKGQLKRYMFDDGYLKLYTNTFAPRFFIKDHLGNNRIVTDGSGNIQQNTNYYPYGGMTYISTNQGEQQFKYNGKEYDPMHGLNEYDYGARQYDPAIGKFTTMDPLCEKYYHISPYAYCGGNPVVFFDPNGEEPTPAEAALMAMHVTGRWGNWILSGGWKPSATNLGIELPQTEGLKSRIYERELEDHSKEYAYVTAGTDFFSYDDWKNNFLQLSGESTQYRESVGVARKLADLIDKKYLTFVGFSLGGGLASANAEATGYKAITFNAAGLSNATKRNLELNIPAEIDAYIVQGEIVDKLQGMIGLKAEGNIQHLPPLGMCIPLSPELNILRPIISHDINLINAYYYINNLFK
jgi:RHS repeat-associated protein